jgi:hypothetical protein
MTEEEHERHQARLLQLGRNGTEVMEILDDVAKEGVRAGLGGHEFNQGHARAIRVAREEVRKRFRKEQT